MSNQVSNALLCSEDATMVDVAIADLSPKALDYAVAMAAGWKIEVLDMGFNVETIFQKPSPFPRQTICSATTNWHQLGSLIVSFPIALSNQDSGKGDGSFRASAHCFTSGTTFETDDGVSVAACRAIVSLTLGHAVSVPRVLQRCKTPTVIQS